MAALLVIAGLMLGAHCCNPTTTHAVVKALTAYGLVVVGAVCASGGA